MTLMRAATSWAIFLNIRAAGEAEQNSGAHVWF